MKAGHEVLCKQHATAGRGRFGRLTVGRMGFDLIGRATKRMAVEALHLLVSRKPHDVTAAESMRSAPTVKFDCAQFVAEACRRAEATCRAGLWIALSEHSPFRHDYVIVRRMTQMVPWLAEPIPRGSRRGAVAQRLLIYFQPWVRA